MLRRLAFAASAAMLPLMLATPSAAQAAPNAPAASPADAALLKLFHDSDEDMLKRNPLAALFRGDMRYADTLGDPLSDKSIAAGKAADERDLATLRAIDRARLTRTDQIAYDVFKWQTELDLKGYDPALLKPSIERPIDHFNGFHIFYPDIASGQGAAPFNTLVDYENNLKRHADYVRILDEAIARFRQGMADKIVQPKLVVNNVIDQLNLQIAQGVEGSTYYGPVTKFPAAISAADQARLKIEYTAIIRDRIIPAETRLRDFLKNEYLPVARDSVGLSAMPGGDKLYAYMIESNTTLPLTADYVHNLGLSKVARITKEMQAQQAAVGFKGTMPEFFAMLRSDPRFQPKSAEAMRDAFFAIRDRVMRRIPEQFSLVPKSPLDIRPEPPYKEKTAAGGEYMQGTPDGSRPGVFYYNSYDLPSRYTWGYETLFLHEAIPGHHFQISLAQEDPSLPAFMRFGGNTAYIEGWALYSESLWKDLGMETDPYQRMGGLTDEMLRAMRLVVDTGIHAQGWSRDQAIAYMLANSPMSKTDATAEVERYIAIPGQALAYKIGQLTILKLKAEAKAALGAKFDPRGFHAVVLDTGALPMTVLEEKVRAWIASQKQG